MSRGDPGYIRPFRRTLYPTLRERVRALKAYAATSVGSREEEATLRQFMRGATAAEIEECARHTVRTAYPFMRSAIEARESRALWSRLDRAGYAERALRELNALQRFFRLREFSEDDGVRGRIPPQQLARSARAVIIDAARAITLCTGLVPVEATREMVRLGLA